FPKFISGTFFTLNLFSVILFEGYDIEFLFSSLMSNVFESIVSSMQFIGLIIMSLPIIFSQSVFFMQSRKVSQLIVINPDGVPIFDFNFESAKNQCDANLLNESFRAISSVMETGEITCQELRSMNFGELQILTEIRNHFAVLLVVDRPTLFLNRSLEMFADDFMKIYPKHQPLEDVPIQEIKVTAEKMIQKDFGLEQEEFEQIREIVQEGYDRVADEYLAARADDTDEIRLLDDLLKRLPEDSKILDAGCGAGIPITNKLSTKHNVIGVDISRKQIEIARDLCPEAEFIWQDITTLTYPDEYFDAIVSYYTISHIPREEHKGVLENFYRMLKKEGYALLAFATTDDPGTVVDDFFGVKMYWSSFDASTNIAMLKEIGFKIAWVKLIFDSITDKQNLVVLAQKTEKELEEYAEINFEKEKKEESEE
ncbi:MAG: methyltransferase domain-containing protein, partial [Asgard group archaeon]|nr:methyltransferase domain-containing protein [Asgard group archaeon]